MSENAVYVGLGTRQPLEIGHNFRELADGGLGPVNRLAVGLSIVTIP